MVWHLTCKRCGIWLLFASLRGKLRSAGLGLKEQSGGGVGCLATARMRNAQDRFFDCAKASCFWWRPSVWPRRES